MGWSPAPGAFTKFVKQIINVIRNPMLIKSPMPWMIRDNLRAIGKYLISAFLDDLLGLTKGTIANNLLC
jgi:hypothetical protein